MLPAISLSLIPSANRCIEIRNWRSDRKNTRLGFFDAILPSGLVINRCILHEKNGVRWVAFPGHQYKKADGSIGYVALIQFASEKARNRFRAETLAAVDSILGGAGHE